jgi:hypothetical protein
MLQGSATVIRAGKEGSSRSSRNRYLSGVYNLHGDKLILCDASAAASGSLFNRFNMKKRVQQTAKGWVPTQYASQLNCTCVQAWATV